MKTIKFYLNTIIVLVLLTACSKDPVPYERKEGIIIDQGNLKEYAWADLTYGNTGWIQRPNKHTSKDSQNSYYYFFDGEDVVIQSTEKPTRVLYFETAKSKPVHLEPNGKNVVRVKLGEYGSFNFQYPLND